MIACRTTIGFGSPNKQGTQKAHGSALGAAEVELTRAKLGWSYPPFEIPADCLAAWRAAGARSRGIREAWEARLAANAKREAFSRANACEIPADFAGRMATYKAGLVANKPECGDPQVLGNGARSDQRRDSDRARRLGGPHRVQSHADEGHLHRLRRATSPAGTFTTASANSA